MAMQRQQIQQEEACGMMSNEASKQMKEKDIPLVQGNQQIKVKNIQGERFQG